MTLNIGSSLTGGFRRVANRNGLALILAYAVLGIAWQVTFYSAFVTWLQGTDVPTSDLALPTVKAPFAALAAGAVLSLLLLQYLTVVAVRTFVGGHARSIPSEYYTRNIVFVLVNSVLAGIAYGLLVFVGAILFLLPGIVAYVAFLFTTLYVAVEDENFVAALRDSWTLTRDHWLRLFALVLIMFVAVGLVAGILSVFVMLAVAAAGSEGIGTLASGVIYLPFSLLTLAILAEAFTQLRAGDATGDEERVEL